MDAKQLLQVMWVVEAAALIVLTALGLAALPADRLGVMLQVLPILTALIGGQGLAAAAGPEIKRWLESRNGKVDART